MNYNSTAPIIDQYNALKQAISLLDDNNAQNKAQASLVVGEVLLQAVGCDPKALALIDCFPETFADVKDFFSEAIKFLSIAKQQKIAKAYRLMGEAFIDKNENISFSCFRDGMILGDAESAFEFESMLKS